MPIAKQIAEALEAAHEQGISAITDVAHDALRFLMIKDEGNDDRPASLASMVVVLNWGEELKRLVPTK